MPVDRDTLKATIREAIGDDGELYAMLEQKLLANDEKAAQFVGGFMRDKDYRTKTQGLADDRRLMESQAEQQRQLADQYRQQLETAEAKSTKVLQDLANHKE